MTGRGLRWVVLVLMVALVASPSWLPSLSSEFRAAAIPEVTPNGIRWRLYFRDKNPGAPLMAHEMFHGLAERSHLPYGVPIAATSEYLLEASTSALKDPAVRRIFNESRESANAILQEPRGKDRLINSIDALIRPHLDGIESFESYEDAAKLAGILSVLTPDPKRAPLYTLATGLPARTAVRSVEDSALQTLALTLWHAGNVLEIAEAGLRVRSTFNRSTPGYSNVMDDLNVEAQMRERMGGGSRDGLMWVLLYGLLKDTNKPPELSENSFTVSQYDPPCASREHHWGPQGLTLSMTTRDNQIVATHLTSIMLDGVTKMVQEAGLRAGVKVSVGDSERFDSEMRGAVSIKWSDVAFMPVQTILEAEGCEFVAGHLILSTHDPNVETIKGELERHVLTPR